MPEFCCSCSKNVMTVRLSEHSTYLELMRRKVISLKNMKLRVDT